MKTLIYSTHAFDKPALQLSAENKHQFIFTEESLNKKTAELSKGFEAISLFTSDIANSENLEILKNNGIKYIALRSVGFDHIDLLKAKFLGIKVANVPAYSPYAIAEHSVALLLALNRKLLIGQQLMQKNDFRLDELIGFDLHGKTIGIVGTGKIGVAFAKIMKGFGCKLIAYDIKENKEIIKELDLEYVSIIDLCKKSDVISVNCPLNTNTKYLFNEDTFSIMKKNVLFINTARGGIVNTNDLLKALDAEKIGGAGLDVYENEKPIFFYNHMNSTLNDPVFDRLRTNPKVLLTGHQAFLTNEALLGIAETTVINLTEWEKFGKSQNDL